MALMGAGVLACSAFVHVIALLLVTPCNDVAGIASAYVAICEIMAVMFTAATCFLRTSACMMATQFIRRIATVIGIVTNLRALNTFLVGALVLCVQVARLLLACTQGHVVFIRAVTAIVHAVANLVASYASVVGALESSQGVTIEIVAYLWILIGAVTAVIGAVTNIRGGNA